jgi:MFS transporter, PPP family, 3-phenylpropionic acid transporter
MTMGIPYFLIFAAYGVVNTYLPILLFNLGYTPTMIGVLQGVFDAAGLVFPIFISARVDAKGKYGLSMLLLSASMLAALPFLAFGRHLAITALALALFAVGYKGAVPVGDALASRLLDNDKTKYGKVRVLGSVGFVCMALLLQFSPLDDSKSPKSITLWIAIPVALFGLSIVVIPGLLKKYPPQDEGARLKDAEPGARTSIIARFSPSFWIGIALIFLAYLGLTPSQKFLSLYVQRYLHLESYAGLWALSAAAEVPFMFLSGWFIVKFGTERIIALSLVAIVLRNLVYAAIPTFEGAVIGQLFHSVCFGLFHPAAVVFITERVQKRLLAVGMTLYSSVSVGIASVLGNVTGGVVIDTLGYRSLFLVYSAFPLIALALFVAFKDTLYRKAAR